MSGGEISNNQVTEYGGGIYASSDSQNLNIKITSGSIIGNIANKHGGAVGVNMAEGLEAVIIVGLESCNGLDDSHSHPIIKNNVANETGGGFCMHGDSISMSMYCGSIESNIAVLEPGSANIYQTGGMATVYSGTVGEGVIVIGGKYDYIPDDGIEETYITYNSNIEGDIQTKVAQVTIGVEIYLPKLLFTRENYILIGWSYLQNPTSEEDILEAGAPYLVTGEDVTVYAVWRAIGAGEIKSPIIKAGKNYDEITGEANVMISADSEFTTQMIVTDVEQSWYDDRILSFDKNLSIGTTILMIDISNTGDRKFYYYKVSNSEINSIVLTDFKNINSNEDYINPVSDELVNEAYLFIIDLPKDNTNIGTTQLTLTRCSNKEDVADIEQTVTYTTTEKRMFSLIMAEEAITLEDEIKLSYEKINPSGEDTRFLNKNMALVITAAEGEALLEETEIFDGENYYKINADGKFIIPLNGVTENFELNLKLISNVLTENEQSCNIKAELWVSANENAENPFMGDKVAEIEKINLSEIEAPAVKIEMNKRIYSVSEFDGKLKLNYNTKKIDGCTVTLEVQKKNENGGYETLNNILSSVDSSADNENGVFNVELLDDGTINLEINDSQNAEIGTYRILMKVIENEEVILTVPYNFIILE